MKYIISLVLLLSLLVITTTYGEDGKSWEKGERANFDIIFPFRVALKHRNLHLLETTLLDVSNPNSENYGKHWSADAILDLVSPPSEVSDRVSAYLSAMGVFNIENKRDFITGEASVGVIEKLFQTNLFNFKHVSGDQNIIRSDEDSTVPDPITGDIAFVAGLHDFPHLHKMRSPRSGPTPKPTHADHGYITPEIVQNLYQLPSSYISTTNSSLCLGEFKKDRSYSTTDLEIFSEQMNIKQIKVAKVVGPFNPKHADIEASLDVEYGAAIAVDTEIWYWTTKGWLYEFASDMANSKEIPLVVSMSWGWPEPYQCFVTKCSGITSLQYIDRCNAEFMKLGLRGVTLLAASGDLGALGEPNSLCSNSVTPLSTIFPGASPYVLSIGATMLAKPKKHHINSSVNSPPICKKFPCANSTTEVVCSYPYGKITTGGGFSVYHSVPAYQEHAVKKYLKSGVTLPHERNFNRSNRGFPDVSALGHKYLIACRNELFAVDGTSCSSPVFGGVIALLNSWRLSNGKAPMGFINPFIYEAHKNDKSIFNDMTVGNNKCSDSCCIDQGYESTKGWDPVTGLGTPNFPALLAYVKSLKN